MKKSYKLKKQVGNKYECVCSPKKRIYMHNNNMLKYKYHSK